MAGGGIVSVEQDPEKKDRYYALTGTGEKLAFHGEPGRKLFDQYSGATADAGGFFKNAAAGALGSIVPGGNLIAKGVENLSRSDAAPPPLRQEPPPGAPAASPAATPASPIRQAASSALDATAPLVGAGVKAARAAIDGADRLTRGTPGPAQLDVPGAEPADSSQAVAGESAQADAAPQQGAPRPVGPMGHAAEGFDPVTGKSFVGEAVMTDGGVRVYRQGTRGTPGGLTGLGEQTLEQMTETNRKIAQAREIEARGREAGALAAIEDSAAQQEYQRERERQAFAQAQETDSEIQDIERQKKDKEIEFAKAKTMFTESRIDPDRYMRGNWLATLGMALGAAGASLRGGGPNFAQEYVQGRINADIRAQELAIDLKGKHADNALADLNKTLGSLVDAKQAYKQFMTEAAAAKFSALALRTTDKQLAAKYQESAGQLMGLYAQQDQERQIKNQEKIWGEKMYYRQGTAGTTGGFFVPTQQGLGAISDEGRANEKLKLEQAAKDKDAKDKAGSVSATVAQQLAEIDAAQSGLRKMMQYHADKGKPGVFTTGVMASEESQRLGADVEALAPIIGRGLEGNAPNEGTMKAIRERMLSASGSKIQTSAASYFRQLEEKKRALKKQAAQQQLQGTQTGTPEP